MEINVTKTTGKWFLKTKDGEIYDFYHDHEENISPLERIDDFDRGDFWSIDIMDENEKYNKDPEDDSFYLIPKDDIVDVWFEKYRKENKPKELKSYNIEDVMRKIGF